MCIVDGHTPCGSNMQQSSPVRKLLPQAIARWGRKRIVAAVDTKRDPSSRLPQWGMRYATTSHGAVAAERGSPPSQEAGPKIRKMPDLLMSSGNTPCTESLARMLGGWCVGEISREEN